MYGNRKGAMTNGLGNNSTRLCYNAPHAWFLGWYQEKRISLDFTKRGAFESSLIGMDHEYHNPLISGTTPSSTSGNKHYVIIKTEKGSTDFFLGLNAAKGINTDTKEYPNEVLLFQQERTNMTHLVAKFNGPGEYNTLANNNYLGLGKKLLIKILKINLNADPPLADVQIKNLEEFGPGVCSKECDVCCDNLHCNHGDPCVQGTCATYSGCEYDTSACPGNFVFTVKTDDWPHKTLFQLVNICSGSTVLSKGDYKGKGTKFVTKATLQYQLLYTLTVRDCLGGRYCYNMGEGFYSATLDGQPLAEGGDFGSANLIYSVVSRLGLGFLLRKQDVTHRGTSCCSNGTHAGSCCRTPHNAVIAYRTIDTAPHRIA